MHDSTKTASLITKLMGRMVHDVEIVDHDGFDGSSVKAFMINGACLIYPHEVLVSTVSGMQAIPMWAVDALVDASDPAVGISGCEPELRKSGLLFTDAVVEAARLLAEQTVLHNARSVA